MRGSRAAVAAAVAAVALSACTPAEGGPLTGPRPEAGSVQICLPAGTDRQVHFGEPLTNEGTQPVEITGVRGCGENLDTVAYFIDTQGPALGELLGGFAWPAGEDLIGPEERVLDRMTGADEVVVEPGNTVALIIQAMPAAADAFAVVTEMIVTYRSGGRTYREPVLVEYGIAPGARC